MINRVILRGFVASEPIIRATESSRFATLRMATMERLTDHRTGRMREHTEWHTISMFGSNAVLVDERVRIGMSIEVEGALRSREWNDKSGAVRKVTEVAVTRLEILEPIEGYTLPKAIQDQMPIEYPKSMMPPPQYEVKTPAADPDDLPF